MLSMFLSCDFFDVKKKKQEELIQKNMKDINFNEVDQFPLFENCDETLVKSEQQSCFEQEMHQYFSAVLQKHHFTVSSAVNDTVFLHFSIDNKGAISFLETQKSEQISKELPELDSIFKVETHQLPQIFPAVKRGIPVATKYKLPIIIKVEE